MRVKINSEHLTVCSRPLVIECWRVRHELFDDDHDHHDCAPRSVDIYAVSVLVRLNIRLLKTDKNTSSYSREGFKQPLPRVTLGIELSKTHLELL